MENVEKGLSLQELFNIVIKRKFIAIITTLSIIIVLLLFTLLIYNPKNAKYKFEYEYSFYGLYDGKYPDGSIYDYRVLLTLDVLNDVKSSSEKYKNIDVDKIVNEGGIGISETYQASDVTIIETGGKLEGVYINYYQFEIKAKYFDSKDIAKSFISDLTYYPIKKAFDIADSLSYDQYVVQANNASSYETQLEMLDKQAKVIIDGYNETIEDFGNIIIDNKSLSDLKAEFELYLIDNSIDSLKADLENNHYIKGEAGSILFEEKVVSLSQNLKNYTTIYEDAKGEAIKSSIGFYKHDKSEITYTGSSSLVVTLVGGIILGVIVGALTAIGVDYFKKKKENE